MGHRQNWKVSNHSSLEDIRWKKWPQFLLIVSSRDINNFCILAVTPHRLQHLWNTNDYKLMIHTNEWFPVAIVTHFKAWYTEYSNKI